MPMYDYVCEKCEHEWTEEQKMSDPKTEECPKCSEKSAKRLISKGGSFHLKGSGWFNSGGY